MATKASGMHLDIKRIFLSLAALCALGAVFALANGGFNIVKTANVPAATTVTSEADTSKTDLPDANYASKPLLEARKRGLAAESAKLADPTKRGTIDPVAVDPYTRADYPEVVREWGKLVPTINRERKQAAQIASRNTRCDGVDNAQITDGGTKTNRHYMIECNNLTRIYFDSASLVAGRPSIVRTQADIGAQGMPDW